MIMPLDILNRKFKKGFKGYNTEEVDSFMEDISEDYENLYKENIDLKDKITILNEAVQHYKNIEHTLQNTLLIAQKTSEDIKNTAYQTADSIKKEAEIESQGIRNQSKMEIEQLSKEYEFLKRQYETFKIKFRAMLTSQIEAIEQQPFDTGEDFYQQVRNRLEVNSKDELHSMDENLAANEQDIEAEDDLNA